MSGQQIPLTKNGHVHGEAFCLMWYECKDIRCGHRERIWNCRDGVTPFGMCCPSCGGHELYHVEFKNDLYAPEHRLRAGQRYWRDGTPDEAEAIMRRRIELIGKDRSNPQSYYDDLVQMARKGECDEFRKGWPALSIHGYEKA